MCYFDVVDGFIGYEELEVISLSGFVVLEIVICPIAAFEICINVKSGKMLKEFFKSKGKSMFSNIFRKILIGTLNAYIFYLFPMLILILINRYEQIARVRF